MSGEDLDAMSIEELLTAMVQHSIDNPTHGRGCACRDRYAWALNRRTNREQREELRYLVQLTTR